MKWASSASGHLSRAIRLEEYQATSLHAFTLGQVERVGKRDSHVSLGRRTPMGRLARMLPTRSSPALALRQIGTPFAGSFLLGVGICVDFAGHRTGPHHWPAARRRTAMALHVQSNAELLYGVTFALIFGI